MATSARWRAGRQAGEQTEAKVQLITTTNAAVMMEDDAMEQQNMNRPDMSECISSSTLIFDAGHMRSSQ